MKYILYKQDDQRRICHTYSSWDDESNGSTTIYSGLFEDRISTGDRLYHISTPVGIAALVVTNKYDTSQKRYLLSLQRLPRFFDSCSEEGQHGIGANE